MQTQQNRNFLFPLAILSLFVLSAVSCSNDEAVDVEPTSVGNPPSLEVSAPRPVSPPNQKEFVDSDILLQWEWPHELTAEQVFAVRIWYENETYIETWTKETSIDAQEYIDSFSRDLGAFHWQVAAINYSSQNGFESMASDWTPVQTLNRLRRLIPTPYPASQQSALARSIAAQHMASTEIIDYARHYIYVNSAFDYQEPGEPNRRDALDAMVLYTQGKGEMPQLLCDGRATAMLTLLEELGIESRLILLYRDGGDAIQEHTVLEVFNPDTQRWEIQDSYQDLYYLSTDTQERASIERLVFGSLSTIAACDGVTCYAEKELSNPAAALGYFQVFRFGASNTFWVNPDRFNISKRFPDENNANLPEYLRSDPRELTFQFYSWEN